MGEMIRMAMDDGAEIAVYHAPAEGERRGGLVLIQEIFGVTDHIRELADEYAADGYEVLAPALFDRAADLLLRDARGQGDNDFKIPLLRRALAAVLTEATGA